MVIMPVITPNLSARSDTQFRNEALSDMLILEGGGCNGSLVMKCQV